MHNRREEPSLPPCQARLCQFAQGAPADSLPPDSAHHIGHFLDQRELNFSMTDYHRWLLAQLKFVEMIDKHPEPQFQHFDELRSIISEAGQRASVAGLPIAVEACEVRQGPVSPDLARKILATCLATIEPASDLLSVAQAANRLHVRPRVIYEACAAGQLRHRRVGRQIRITPNDADRFSTVSFSSQNDDDRHARR